MSEREIRRSIQLLYLSKIFGAGIMFTIPCFMRFLQDVHGMGFAGAAVLEFMFGLTAFFLDGPGGRFADLFGRRVSLLIGRLLLASGCFVYSAASGVPLLFPAEMLIAAGVAFSLSADEAFVRSLFPRTEEGDGKFARTMSVAFGIDMISGAVAMFYSRSLFDISPQLPFMVATACYLTAAVLVLLLREPPRNRIAAKGAGVAEMRKRCAETPILRELIVFQAVVGFFLGGAIFLQEPYLRHTNVDTAYDGYIFAAYGICAGVGTLLTPRISDALGLRSTQALVFGSLAIGLTLLGSICGSGSFVFLVLLSMARGMYPAVVSRPFNAAIEEDSRATALSIKSMCFRIGDWSGKTFGLLLAAELGVQITLVVLGILALGTIGGAAFLRAQRFR